ncbi:hypothetical protein IW492_14195 [Enterococcus sp. BWB1-3]|uniref:hypothetical protein n=1 Tax=Enterococcus sp. BWB1-3 TaxID=2787713 RepID=UPI001922B181|nr:hypothetical protein [Enterococcus sp. BWB1-3]MBL1230382.1 hypothetical protein [Enterococcus sp. BWB1-3]
MSIEEMDRLAEEIDKMILDILLPARAEKKIGEKDFEKLKGILNDLKIRLSDAPVISRKLSGILFFMYHYRMKQSLLM